MQPLENRDCLNCFVYRDKKTDKASFDFRLYGHKTYLIMRPDLGVAALLNNKYEARCGCCTFHASLSLGTGQLQ